MLYVNSFRNNIDAIKRNTNNGQKNRISFAGLPKCDFLPQMEKFAGQIRNTGITIALGDMTKVRAGAYIVPHFDKAASYGGVGGAVARAGAINGIEEFEQFVSKKGQQKFGTILLTKSHGGNSENLLHAVSVGSGRTEEFKTVQASIYNALRTAEQNNIKSVAAPALGTGIIGHLTDEQSAKAILSAVEQFANEGRNIDFGIVIYGDRNAYNAFVKTLSTKSYSNALQEVGTKELDFAKWYVEMNNDMAKNANAEIW